MNPIGMCKKSAPIFMTMAMLTILLMGCQGSLVTGTGDQLLQESRIPIAPSGEQSGQYQSNDLTVNYTYSRKGANTLEVGGVVTFSSNLQMNFNVLNIFNFGLILADSSGTVLGQQDLAVAGPINFTEGGPSTVNFNKTLQIPPQTAAIAFKYTGQASGDMHGEPTDFFSDPIAR